MEGYDPALVSPCGLYCGVCAIRLAHLEGNRGMKEKLLNLYQGKTPGLGALPGAENLTVDDIRCGGCGSEDLFMHCRQCEIRACTAEKGIDGCHRCNEFPCRHIDDFSMAVGKKVILRCVPRRREISDEEWVAEEEARYHCPACGNKVFRGAMRCNRCKEPLSLD